MDLAFLVIESDSDDFDQSAKSCEVVGIARVERQSVRVSGCRDKEICNARPMRPSHLSDGRNDLSITARR